MNLFNKILRDPVLHFIVAGGLLYAAAAWVRGPDLLPADDAVITVDRDSLLTFLQFRSNAFDQEAFEQAFDNLSEAELQALIDEFVTEEVLYREARALDLEASDYNIRQRMVQKMQFLLADLAGDEANFSDAELQAWFEANREVWLVLPSATFTHVFFDSGKRGAEQARLDAQAALEDFNRRNVGFNDAGGEGDRFPFLRNYVERTFDYLQGQFGTSFVETMSGLQASEQWQGPLPSAYGWHIVLMTEKQDARYPELDEVRSSVESDLMRQRSAESLREITQTLRQRYTVELEGLTLDQPE